MQNNCISGNYNIALNKPTEQRPYDFCGKKCRQYWTNGTTCSRCYGSRLAVDGNTNPWFHLDSCSHTDTEAINKTASWSVDLEGLYYLLRINIIPSMLNLYSAMVCFCYVNSNDVLLEC